MNAREGFALYCFIKLNVFIIIALYLLHCTCSAHMILSIDSLSEVLSLVGEDRGETVSIPLLSEGTSSSLE